MAGRPVGTAFAEISLDATPLERGLKRVNEQLVSGSIKVEDAYKSLGIKSDKVYEQMRQNATAAVDFIKNKTLSSTEEIARAQQAAVDKLKKINEQQYGAQTTLLDSMKKNWIAASAVVVAAWMAVGKAMEYAQLGAKAQQAEESFRIVAASAGESADKIIAGMKRAAQGTVDDSDIMQKAVKGMVLGLKGDEMVKIMETARVAARVAGQDVQTAYENITNAISTGMPRALKQYGLATKEETAIVEQALKAGVKGINLYTLAMMNAGIQAEKMGEMHRNAAEGLQVFHAQVNEIKENVGKATIAVSGYLLAGFNGLAAFIVRAAQGMATVLSIVPGAIGEAAKNAQSILGGVSADLMKDRARLLGVVTGEEKKAADEAAKGSAARIAAAEKEKAAWLASLKAQIDAAKGGDKSDPAMERRLREVAKMYAEEGKIVHDALMDEMGMTQEYHDTLRKLDDEAWKEEKRIAEEIVKLDAKRYAEEGAIAMEALAAEMGMTQEYIDTVRGLRDAEFEAWKEAHDPKTMADFYDSIVGYEQEAHDAKVALINAERDARIAAGVDAVAASKKAAQDIGELNQKVFEKNARAVYNAAGDMAQAFDAIGSMYDKNSAEYARMQEAAKAMIVLQQAVAVANAVAAIANQGLGDPYTAFARIAAMAAAMGTLLASIGASVSGGGASSSPVLPPSTVLGAEAGTGSESITNSWEKLMDIDTLQYRELSGIHDSMKELNQNITGLVTSIVRTGGVGSFTAPGMEEGLVQGAFRGIDAIPIKLLGGDPIGKFIFEKISDLAGKALEYLGFGSKSFEATAGGIYFGAKGSGSLDSAMLTKTSQSVNDFLNGIAAAAIKFTDIKVTGSKGDTWMNSAFESLNADTTRLVTLVYKGLSENLVEMAEMFGTDMEKARGYIFESFKLDLSKYTTGEEINKALSDYFSKVADNAATAIFGEFVLSYQKLSEGPFQTAIRLATDMTIVMETLAATGQHFAGTIPQIIAFSEAIIAMAGGLDKLQEISATYSDKFFTDAEKQARLQTQLSGGLGSLGYALPAARDGYRAIVESLDLTTEAGQRAYVMLMKWSEKADAYYTAVEDAVGSTDKLTESLKKQSAAIQAWLHDINLSALAPVTSREAWSSEYERQKAMASAFGATDQDVSSYLNYAKEYLQFMRTYGGDYQAIFDAVVGDVRQLGEIKDAQILAIEAADAAARVNADRIIAAITGRDIGPPMPPLRTYAGGGLTSGPSMAGEAGREWVVPTYEPQRSQFLEKVPPQFWDNLRGGGAVSGGGGDITIRLVNVLDGKVLTDTVAKHIPRNANLSEAIRRVS